MIFIINYYKFSSFSGFLCLCMSQVAALGFQAIDCVAVFYFPMIYEDLSVAVEVSDAQLVEGDVLVQLKRRLLLARGRRIESAHPVREAVLPDVIIFGISPLSGMLKKTTSLLLYLDIW